MSNFKVGDIVRYNVNGPGFDPGRGLVSKIDAEGITVFWFANPGWHTTLLESYLTKVEVRGE